MHTLRKSKCLALPLSLLPFFLEEEAVSSTSASASISLGLPSSSGPEAAKVCVEGEVGRNGSITTAARALPRPPMDGMGEDKKATPTEREDMVTSRKTAPQYTHTLRLRVMIRG